jgi:hypothetical protein
VRKVKAPFYLDRPPSTLRFGTVARIVVGTLLAAPFLYEGAQLCYARWARMLGGRVPVRTPVLNRSGVLARSFGSMIAEQFHRVPWNPQVVLVIGVVSCTVCMILLKGKGSRVE